MGTIYKKDDIYWILYRYKNSCCTESSHSGEEMKARNLLKKREEQISRGEAPDIMIEFDNPRQAKRFLNFEESIRKGQKKKGEPLSEEDNERIEWAKKFLRDSKKRGRFRLSSINRITRNKKLK